MKHVWVIWLILSIIVFALLLMIKPAETVSVQRTNPTIKSTLTCPEDTDEIIYRTKGYNKYGGVVCGFTWVNECPYYGGAPKDDPACEQAGIDQGRITPELEAPVEMVGK